MNFKMVFRSLVCLLVVCCLIINVSPIKAQATMAGLLASPYAIPITLGILAVLIALGIQTSDTDPTAIDDLVSYAADYSEINSYAVDGMVNFFDVTVDGRRTFSVDTGFVSAIRDFLFQIGYLFAVDYYYPGTTVYKANWHSNYQQIITYTAHFLVYNPLTKIYQAFGSNEEIITKNLADGTISYQTASGNQMRYAASNDNNLSYASAVEVTSGMTVHSVDYVAQPGVMSWMDVAIADVADPDDDLPAGYPHWHENAITIPGSVAGTSSDVLSYPIGITDTSTYEDTKVKVQAEMQQSAFADTVTDSGTVSGAVTLPGWLQEVLSNIFNGLKDILSSILSLPVSIAKAIWDACPAWLQDGILNIVTGFADVLVTTFAISDTFIATKVEALTASYPYLDTFLALGADLKAFFLGLGTTPPVIYIDLGASEGSYNIGGQQVFMDLSWYARYKPTMDTVLGGFIWLWLAWRVYLSIPGIISGASGVWGAYTRHSERTIKAVKKEDSA